MTSWLSGADIIIVMIWKRLNRSSFMELRPNSEGLHKENDEIDGDNDNRFDDCTLASIKLSGDKRPLLCLRVSLTAALRYR